jgi:hypothetical protein
MSFVVEVPSVFTKATQIPQRLGNTVLTGSETIHGNCVVNGSLTLNGNADSTNPVNDPILYFSMDIINNLKVGGNLDVSGTLDVSGIDIYAFLQDISARIHLAGF